MFNWQRNQTVFRFLLTFVFFFKLCIHEITFCLLAQNKNTKQKLITQVLQFYNHGNHLTLKCLENKVTDLVRNIINYIRIGNAYLPNLQGRNARVDITFLWNGGIIELHSVELAQDVTWFFSGTWSLTFKILTSTLQNNHRNRFTNT